MADTPAIETRRLSKRFGDLLAVDSLDISVRSGEMFALVGPDGSGKTTIIRMLTGILAPSSGSAFILGHDIASDRDVVKGKIGYLSQRFTLYGDLTVDENIEFFAEIHGVADFKSQRDELLRFTRLTPFRSRPAERLSGGMKQKLALACTLIHTPDVLLLDEPTTGVDPVSRRDFWMILHSLIGRGMTILMTTPYLDEAERCSRVALMNKGKLMDAGTPVDLRKHMKGEILEIVCKPVKTAFQALEDVETIESVQAFGDRLNIVVRDPSAETIRVKQILKTAGVEVSGFRKIKPTLENIFISMLSRQDVQEAEQ